MNAHGIIAALLLVLVMSPVVTGGLLRRFRPRRRKSRKSSRHNLPTITDIVFTSGDPFTYDDNMYDYDILRDGIISAGLEDALATTEDITVFAPNDYAFFRTAVELGHDETYDEQELSIFVTNILEENFCETVIRVLSYHVVPEKISASRLKRLSKVDTLLGLSLNVSSTRGRIILEDESTPLQNPKVRKPFNIWAKNGIVHTIDRVLIPFQF